MSEKEVGWRGLSGSTLKMFAVVTMLIDHVAAAVLMRMLRVEYDRELYDVYFAMRQIGRIAFPIYCFMLVEGLSHTRDKWKYAARLGGFALLSEIPFDLAFSGKVLEFRYQNVFFTLAIGLVTLCVLDEIDGKVLMPHNPGARSRVKFVLTLFASMAGMGLAALLRTDYDYRGVACIVVLYYFRRERVLQLIMGYLIFVAALNEWAALPAFVALAFYRGRKGFSGKLFFYGFYPVHLFLLYLTCVLMGIARYPAI